MPARTLTIRYADLTEQELSLTERRVCDAARAAVEGAYAPYSRFRVGAAALLGDGALVASSNLENAAYPQCLCAEATLLGALHSQRPGEAIELLAVAARDASGAWARAAPCGSCRQQLLEAEGRQGGGFPLLLAYAGGRALRFPSVGALLPMGFAM